MLGFFRTNDPYRLSGVFVVLILTRIPYWILSEPVMLDELQWMVVGERMAAGFQMYSEIWDNISPFSAGVYASIEWLFDRSIWVYRIIALVITFLQGFLINRIVSANSLFPEKNYLPSLVFVLVTALSSNFLALSPVLMGTTFLLIALNNVVSQIEFRAEKDEKLFGTGVFLGIAGLFHFPMTVLGILVVVTLLIFSSTVTRRYLLLIFGYLLPQMLLGIYYFFTGGLIFFWEVHVTSWFWLPYVDLFSRSTIIWILLPLLAMVILSMFRIIIRARLNNYQSRIVQVMLAFGTLSTTILLLERSGFDFALYIFIPIFTYFISFFFTLSKRNIVSEISFVIFLVAFIWLAHKNHQVEHMDEIKYVKNEIIKRAEQSQSSAVLSDDFQRYHNSIAATPFVNWRISERSWQQMNRYRFVYIVMNSLLLERPGKVYDENGYFKKLRNRQPLIQSLYIEESEGVFILNP